MVPTVLATAKSVESAKSAQPTSHMPLPSTAALLVILYCGGVLVQLFRLLFGLFASLGLKRRAEVPLDFTMIARFTMFVRTMRVHRKVSFLLSDEVAAPVAIGYWCPGILLHPTLIDQLDVTEMEQVLSHELAHISRYDDWMIAIQKLIEALFFFHPLVHLISRRIDLERELACDDHVIAAYQPRTYAACLTKIAELVEFGSTTPLTVPLLARKSHLASRIEMMLDRTRAHVPYVSIRRLVPFASLAALAALVSMRAPALFAFPAPRPGNMEVEPLIAKAESSPANSTPVQATAPAKQTSSASRSIDSIAVTNENGGTTTFEQNGNERSGHSPFPHGTIVFQRNGETYIIRDRSTVAAAEELLRPQEELSRQQEALGAQQEKLGEAQAKLGEQQEALSNRRLDAAALNDLEKRLHVLEDQIRSIDVEKNVKTASDAQERLAELQSQLGEMQSSMGREQGRSGEAQGKLGEQQGRLGEEQGRLGEQQGKLGEQQAREAKRAEQRLKDLIRKAEEQGLTQPLR